MKQQDFNEISHRLFCRMDENYMSTVRGHVLGTPRLTALKLFPEKVFSSDHNNNSKWAILGTQYACHLPRKDFLIGLKH
jgi:hypothetical protein